jgi:hypothetical protein
MDAFLHCALANFTLTFLVLGLLAAALSLGRRPRPRAAAAVVEDLFAWFLLFPIRISFFYNFVAHVFFGDVAARFIGWEQSPFQTEVGMASLGYSADGLLAFRGGFSLRAAAVVGPRLLPPRGRGRPHLSDDRGAQLRAGQCRSDLLHGRRDSCHQSRPAVAPAQVRA